MFDAKSYSKTTLLLFLSPIRVGLHIFDPTESHLWCESLNGVQVKECY